MMMRIVRTRVYLLYGLGVLAIVFPVLAAIQLAEFESIRDEQNQAARIAGEIRRRGDGIVEQMNVALAELQSTGDANSCSERNLDIMRRLVVKSNLLIDVGFAKGDMLLCSSFGEHPVPIGSPTYRNARGLLVRVDVAHPLAPEAALIAVTDARTGYTVLASQGSALDSTPDEPNLAVGVLSKSTDVTLGQRGYVDPRTFSKISKEQNGANLDGGDIIAWDRSHNAEFVAYAVISSNRVEQDRRRVISILLPIGSFAGLVLVFVVAAVVRRHTSMPALLRSALKHGDLALVYQPIVNLQTGALVGAEALVRWHRPTGEIVSPDIFVPIAERHGLIRQLTDTVIHRIEEEAGWLLRSNPGFYIAINMSAEDFAGDAVVTRLKEAVHTMAIQPNQIHVEATERVFVDPEVARRSILALREYGIPVAIDDFGTGYSSLAHLHSLQLDYLKIDKSFVDTIGKQAVTSHVVGHIISMAKALKVELIAEGVETHQQAEYLRERGVAYAQGWLYSRPLTMAQLLAGLPPPTLAAAGEPARDPGRTDASLVQADD